MLLLSSGGHGDHEHNEELFDAYSFGNGLPNANFNDVDPDKEAAAIQHATDPSFRCCIRGKTDFILDFCMECQI